MYTCFLQNIRFRAQLFKDLWLFYEEKSHGQQSGTLRDAFLNFEFIISLRIHEPCRWNFTEIARACILAFYKISAAERNYSQTYENLKFLFESSAFTTARPLFFFHFEISISLRILELCRWNFTGIERACILAFYKISGSERNYSQTYDNFKKKKTGHQKTAIFGIFFIFVDYISRRCGRFFFWNSVKRNY